MSATEVKCPQELFVREDRRRPRFFFDFFSLALLFLGIVVFAMACYVFLGSSKTETSAPSSMKQVMHNNSEQNTLNRIERMVKQLLKNTERTEQNTRGPIEDNPFLPMFQKNNNPPPVRTRLILRFAMPSMETNSINQNVDDKSQVVSKGPFKEPVEVKEPEMVFSQSKIFSQPIGVDSLNNENLKEKSFEKTKESSEESKESPENPINNLKSLSNNPAEIGQMFDDIFNGMSSSINDPFFSLFKPQFTSFRRSSGPFMMNFTNEPTKAPEPENVSKETSRSGVTGQPEQRITVEQKGNQEPTPASSPRK